VNVAVWLFVKAHFSILGMWLGQVLLYPAGVGVPHDAGFQHPGSSHT